MRPTTEVPPRRQRSRMRSADGRRSANKATTPTKPKSAAKHSDGQKDRMRQRSERRETTEVTRKTTSPEQDEEPQWQMESVRGKAPAISAPDQVLPADSGKLSRMSSMSDMASDEDDAFFKDPQHAPIHPVFQKQLMQLYELLRQDTKAPADATVNAAPSPCPSSQWQGDQRAPSRSISTSAPTTRSSSPNASTNAYLHALQQQKQQQAHLQEQLQQLLRDRLTLNAQVTQRPALVNAMEARPMYDRKEPRQVSLSPPMAEQPRGQSVSPISQEDVVLRQQLCRLATENGLSLPIDALTLALFKEYSTFATSREAKKIVLYKTEICRSYEETGRCRYGARCHFAHSDQEIRQVKRHPRYKTEICRTYWEQGTCPYGKRCCFIHNESEETLKIHRAHQQAISDQAMMPVKPAPFAQQQYAAQHQYAAQQQYAQQYMQQQQYAPYADRRLFTAEPVSYDLAPVRGQPTVRSRQASSERDDDFVRFRQNESRESTLGAQKPKSSVSAAALNALLRQQLEEEKKKLQVEGVTAWTSSMGQSNGKDKAPVRAPPSPPAEPMLPPASSSTLFSHDVSSANLAALFPPPSTTMPKRPSTSQSESESMFVHPFGSMNDGQRSVDQAVAQGSVGAAPLFAPFQGATVYNGFGGHAEHSQVDQFLDSLR